jgi:tetratricopeptide (TPR) repeat protein/serine/threonine protein kinase
MTASRPDNEAIFHAARDIPDPDRRREYVRQACGGDETRIAHVEALLAAADVPDSLLDRPAGGDPFATIDRPTPEGPGTVIGPYRLIQEIGEGGMGTVWMAQQQVPVKRLVAIKLIKAGMDSKQVNARFEAERQALALMDHPNIARVLDAGTTGAGRPYFVMDLVKGVPITRYCDDHHLTPRQRLELFLDVCQAVQHAHQKGIIHRDIKPSNVLVAPYDGKPVPKVIDFGVAKATGQMLTDTTLVTGFGSIVGTLEYMSPEQADTKQLDIDTRSDIYALGVLLYELLTGSPPFTRKELEKASILEMLRVIREQEPSKPSTRLSTAEGLPTLAANRGTEPARLTRLVRGELDWIVMKALEKDRNRRYETANGFALDVRRYLADEPVQACPPSVGYRFGKFVRRNKIVLAGAAMVLAFIAILGSGVGWALRDREAREQEFALENARKLAITGQGIRQALDRAGKTRGELLAVLKKQGGVQKLLNHPGRWELFLETAQAELRQARRLLARAEGELDTELTRALDRLEQRLTSDEADYRLALRLEKVPMARDTQVEGKYDYRKAAEGYSKAFAGFGLPASDPGAVAARVAASPIKEQLVAALDDWAWVAFELTREEELAERLLAVARRAAPHAAWGDRLRQLKVWRDHEAVARLAAEALPARLSPQLLSLVGALLQKDKSLQVAWLLRARAQHPADFWLNYHLAAALGMTDSAEAAGYCRVALAIRPGSGAAYNNLGNILCVQRKLDEAVAAYRKATELDPKSARAYSHLGGALCAQRKLPEAIAAHRKAIELEPQYAPAYSNLGVTLRAQRQLDKAIAAYRKAIDLDPQFAPAYYNLGNALKAKQKVDEAIAAYRKAAEIDPKHSMAYNNLGIALHDKRKRNEAVAAFRKAIELDPKNVMAYTNLAQVLGEQKKRDEAIAFYRKCIDQAVPLDPEFAPLYLNLGIALRGRGRLDEAVAAYRRAIEIAPKNARAYNNLGFALYLQKKLPEAVAAFRKAAELDRQFLKARVNLGNALFDLRKLDESIAAYREAININPKRGDVYYFLGNSLQAQRKPAEAAAAFRKAADLRPNFAEAHCNLGLSLQDLGQFAQALKALQKGDALGRQRGGWRYPSAGWIRACERLLALEEKLPKVLNGAPAGAAEHLGLADLCLRYLQRYDDAARLYGRAFNGEPKFAENLRGNHRFNAARAAVLAAAGKGTRAARSDLTGRTRLRGQALDWLRADLAARRQLLEKNRAAAGAVRKSVQRWLKEPDLTSVRDAKELAELPHEERQGWTELWTAVRKFVRRAEKK